MTPSIFTELITGNSHGLLSLIQHFPPTCFHHSCCFSYSENSTPLLDINSEASVKLAQSIAQKHGEGHESIAFSTLDFLHQSAPSPPSSQEDGWNLLLDKGTYDAIALAPSLPSGKKLIDLYPERVEAALRKGGFFLITCKSLCSSKVL